MSAVSPKICYRVSAERVEPPNVLRFIKISDKARAPARGSPLVAGYDLFSAEDVVVGPRDKALISTNLKISVPPGTNGRVAPRSGIAFLHRIDIDAGIIDQDYQGILCVLLFNHGNKSFKVEIGNKIAQLICEQICHPRLKEVKELGQLEKGYLIFKEAIGRGERGFGSTGMH
jgi:dUTP pyrophosphatase